MQSWKYILIRISYAYFPSCDPPTKVFLYKVIFTTEVVAVPQASQQGEQAINLDTKITRVYL